MLRRLAARFPDRYPLLLDSAATGPLSRASVLLAEPCAALWLGADGRLGAQGFVPQGMSFLAALETWWLAERRAPPPTATGLAFEGGWAVFLGLLGAVGFGVFHVVRYRPRCVIEGPARHLHLSADGSRLVAAESI